MTPWEGMNRRKFPRVNYPCLVIIRHDDEKRDVILTHTENIGSGGLCVTLKKGLKMFSPVDVELDLLDLSDHVKCSGKVVWSVRRADTEKKKPQHYDTGIEFVNIEERDRSRVISVIDRLFKHGMKPVA
jgi:c-di-GMP-binding flagellar brake protein YcgR